MTTADRVISALRSTHDLMAARVSKLTDQDLGQMSGASEWPVHQVLSHIGSGAEIVRGRLETLASGEPLAPDSVERTWDKWNARSPRERADSVVAADADAVAAFEAMDVRVRDELRIDLGFLPQPVDLGDFASMRLREVALHSWDVDVAFDPSATVPAPTAALLISDGPVPLNMMAKAEAAAGHSGFLRVETTDPEVSLGLQIGESIERVAAPDDADGVLSLPAESWVRLKAGRLSPQRTPPEVTITGPWDLDVLRATFPGY